MQPMMSASSGSGGPSNKKPLIIAIIAGAIVLLVAAIGAVVLLVAYSGGSNGNADDAARESTQSSANVTDLSSLRSVTITAPDMTDYEAPTTSEGFTMYLLKSANTSTLRCALTFGTISATLRPGTDLNSILAPQIEKVKKAGATIDGPKPQTALVVTATTGGKQYRMPSLEYTVSKDKIHETDHYSLSILGNGDRAVVSRSCGNANGAVAPSLLATLDATAKRLKVTAQ
jgi:flagellar basal body-associated protein FliL